MTTALPDLLDLIANDPSPWRVAERDRIVAAIATDAELHDGEVNANRVRRLLSNDHGLTVNPRVLSATYSSLRSRGVLRVTGWTTSDDTRGRNGGKPTRLWLWVGAA